MKNSRDWIDTLRKSATFRGYQRAFSETTSLPLSLQAVESWHPPFRGVPKENPFCKMVAGQSRSCAGCLRLQEKLCSNANEEARSSVCHFGMVEVAVPVRFGHKTVAFLRTGQVLSQEPTEQDAERVCAKLEANGMQCDRETVRKLYAETRVQTRKQISSVTQLLTLFAEHLSMKSNMLAICEAHDEPIAVTRAREFVKKHHNEDITLLDAAKAAHTSVYYLCKLLKKHLGVTFTELVCRERIEEAKTLLAKPNMRISEVAFQVGFQSLTHFNRTFKKIVGEAPSEFRETVPLSLAA